MVAEHTVKSFDDELKRLNQVISQMGGLVEMQLQSAVEALVKRDADAAGKVVRDDAKIDELELQSSQLVVRLLALRQPMAVDLRQIVSALKISSDLERIGDYAANVAKRAIALSQAPAVKPLYTIPRMARLVQQIIKDVLDAYVERDAVKAVAAWQRDEEVDEMYTSLFRELLTYMMEDQRNIGPCIHLLFIAKNIERMGDHATNVAEDIHYLVHGTPIDATRPKGDQTSFTVVPPPPGERAAKAAEEVK
ncbi:MAG TPA: phosphate signaling complex protein PhoU [Methylomirabilota bacterium]|nr:phosphate signaling complex protein PhoU [Methylomirabilota bacterium]